MRHPSATRAASCAVPLVASAGIGAILAACALATTLVLAACAAEPGATSEPIDGNELATRIEAGEAPLILDVRTPEEFEKGHLPGARNIPHDSLADRLDELGVAKDAEIVVHCHSGRRAGFAEEALREAGYSNVRDLTGHWQAWQQAGLPTE